MEKKEKLTIEEKKELENYLAELKKRLPLKKGAQEIVALELKKENIEHTFATGKVITLPAKMMLQYFQEVSNQTS